MFSLLDREFVNRQRHADEDQLSYFCRTAQETLGSSALCLEVIDFISTTITSKFHDLCQVEQLEIRWQSVAGIFAEVSNTPKRVKRSLAAEL